MEQVQNNLAAKTNPGLPSSKKIKLPRDVKQSLIVFGLVGSGLLIAVPFLMNSSAEAPSFSLFLGAGLLMISLTLLLFRYLHKLNLGFGESAMVLAVGYNVAIVIIKYILAPQGLYSANAQSAFDDTWGVNTPFYYVLTGLYILFLYMVVFRLIYTFSRNRLWKSLGITNVVRTHNKKIIGLLILAVILTGGGPLIFLLMFAGPGLQYFGLAVGLPVLIAIIAAVYLAYKSFGEVNKQAIATRNVALLSSFYWLGLSLIFLYHIMWVVFMVVLVNLWPFKAVASK